jgi:hypothetical protein
MFWRLPRPADHQAGDDDRLLPAVVANTKISRRFLAFNARVYERASYAAMCSAVALRSANPKNST